MTPLIFESKEIRTQTIDGEIRFMATDVAEVLGFGNPHQAIETHVHDDDLHSAEVIDNLGRTQVGNFINESGIYALIFGSRKPEAKRFKRWVTSEVLPTIRKEGAYVSQTATSEQLETLNARITELIEEKLTLEDDHKVALLRAEQRSDDSLMDLMDQMKKKGKRAGVRQFQQDIVDMEHRLQSEKCSTRLNEIKNNLAEMILAKVFDRRYYPGRIEHLLAKRDQVVGDFLKGKWMTVPIDLESLEEYSGPIRHR